MRVEFTNLGLEPPDKTKPGRTGKPASTATSPAASETSEATSSSQVDRTRLSFDQAKVAALEAKVMAAPEMRQEKVEPLQQAVANGSYPVDTHKVADAMAAELANGRVR